MAEIRFDFVGNADDLMREVDKVGDGLDGAEESAVNFGRVGKVALGVVAAAAAAAAASVVLLSKETLKLAAAGNTYAKSAKKVGSTAEDIQRLEGAFDLLTDANISASRVIQDFGRNLADARDGTGEAKDELAKLGLAAEDFAGLRVDEQIALVADRFGRLQDASEKSQVAMAVFGRAGRELVPALTQGGDAVREAAKQIEESGIISDEVAAQSEELSDAVLLLGREFETLKRGALAPLIPDAIELVGVLSDLIKEAQKSDAIKDMARFILDVSHGAVLAAAELAALLGIIDRTAREAEGGIIKGDSPAIREQMEQVAILERAVKALNQVLADQAANGAISDSTLKRFKAAATQLEEARAALNKMRAEPDEPEEDEPPSGRRTTGSAEAVEAIETEAKALSDLMDAARRMTESRLEGAAALEAAAQREIEDIQEMATAIIDSETATAAERVEARETAADAVLGIEEQLAADLAELRAEARQERADDLAAEVAANQAAADEMRRAREEAEAAQLQSSANFVAGVSDLLNAAAEAEVNQTEAGTAARKEALKKQFEINKATAIANAAVNTVLAASNAFGNAPNPIIGAVLAALATAVGIGQVAAIASKPPPTFHSGTSAIRAADLAPDEGMARVRAGEAVASPQGVANLGGREAIDRANRGGGGGAAPIVVISKVNNRTTDVSTHEQIRRPDSPFSEALRSVQPRPVGSHRVWG